IIRIDRISPYHKVEESETVGSIAQKYKMTRAELIKLNNLQPPYQLYAGQRLIVNRKIEDDALLQENVDITVTETSKVQQKEDKTEIKPVEAPEAPMENVDDIKTEIVEKKEAEYIWPIENGAQKVSKRFGEDGIEGGILIDASAGTPVKAIADGIVIISGVPFGEASAYGVTVAIKHPNKKKMSIYAYLKEANVEVHKTVRKGDLIGKVGKSGTRAEKPQLYFEVSDVSKKERKSIDPEKLLSKE
ncbi:MAG: M23 family metallopeptidase, partial [Holosporales bacterium]|nr:M23 family metallopeptidase [Holosporales bacterium]